jgi:hypothetical protein
MSTVSDNQLDPIRAGLARRINSTAQPSRVINELHSAGLRCEAAAKGLRQLLDRAPRIGPIIRRALHDAFGVDPDTQLLKVPLALEGMPRTRDLVEASLGVMAARQQTPSGLALDDLVGTALSRALGADWPTRFDTAMTRYWDGLATDSWRSRRARWHELYQAFLADQAVLAHGVFELSDHGLDMVQSLLDAPTAEARQQAGGDWATLNVSSLCWPLKGATPVTLSGGLHLYRAGQRHQRHVLFLPWLAQGFHEFVSLAQLQAALPALVSRHLEAWWQRLPLRQRHAVPDLPVAEFPGFSLQPADPIEDDALQQAADAVLAAQWQNEWDTVAQVNLALLFPRDAIRGTHGSLIERLRTVERQRRLLISLRPSLHRALETLLDWDTHRCRDHIHFASLARELPKGACEQTVARYEQGLLALLDPADASQETPAWAQMQVLHQQWQTHQTRALAMLEAHEASLGDLDFWSRKVVGQPPKGILLLRARRGALESEARLQCHLKLISEHQQQQVVEGMVTSGATQVTGVVIEYQRLLGALVIRTAEAVQQPVMLYVPGRLGGLQAFASLARLSEALSASFKAIDRSPLWDCLHRTQRRAVLAKVRALKVEEPVSVEYPQIDGDGLLLAIKEQIKGFNQLDHQLTAGRTVFSEISDPSFARQVLADEAVNSLQVPPCEAFEQALANVQLLRLAAAERKQLPAWLEGAQASQRKRYRRLQASSLRSWQALESGVFKRLPALTAFARDVLIKRLQDDGFYPGLDIDQPLLDMPDDVSSHWVGHPERTAGESGAKIVVSQERQTYSLLQLALHNLDAKAPWARWRLQQAHYLQPAWKDRLSPDYLLATLSRLDLAARYAQQIRQAFYGDPHSDDPQTLRPALLRAFRQAAQWHLFSAVNSGLSESGQRLFALALAAQSRADLERDGHSVQLCTVRLEALTLPAPRHIAGVVVIIDDLDDRCVLYWPDRPEQPTITEYSSLAEARTALIGLVSTPGAKAALALGVAPGWEADALAGYPNDLRVGVGWMEGLLRYALGSDLFHPARWFNRSRVFPAKDLSAIEAEIDDQRAHSQDNWLGITPTEGNHLLELLAHSRVLTAQRQAYSQCNSNDELKAYRAWRLGEQADARWRGLLSFVPVLGLGVKLYEVLLAVRRLHQRHSPEEIFELVTSVHMFVLEVAMTLLPVRGGRAGAKSQAPSMGQVLHRLHRQQHLATGGRFFMRTALPAKRFKGMEGYRSPGAGGDGIALGGRNRGSYLKDGEQFVVDGRDHYPVYRRPGEPALRLKNRQRPGENEWLLQIDEPRQWLLGADAPEPQPGTSAGLFRPWERPAPGTFWSVRSRPTAERVRSQPVLTESYWQAWGHDLAGGSPQVLSASKRLYRVYGEAPFDAVKLGENYFEILPGGLYAPHDVVFVKGPRALAHSAMDDLDRWLGASLSEQPVPFVYGADGRWTPHQPLFSRPLAESVGAAFPGLTQASRRFAVQRLVEVADSSRSMTATRLLNLRTTLDDWLSAVPRAAGYTDDLLKMLRPIELEGKFSVNISTDGLGPGFERVDFLMPFTLEPSLLDKRTVPPSNKFIVAQNAIRQVLERQGFHLETVPKGNRGDLSNFIATHPKSNNVYFILTRWTDLSSIPLSSNRILQLSDEWFDRKLASRGSRGSQRNVQYETVKKAMKERRLVRLVGGIQQDTRWSTFTVFFSRVAGLD